MDDLVSVMESRPLGGGRWAWDVRDGWQQGRGMFGGTVIGAMIRAIEREVGDPARAVRSVTAELPGPTMAGPAEIAVEVLRAGSGQSTVSARVTQEGEVRASCVAVLARDRGIADAEPVVALDPPALRSWREMEPLPMIAGGPTFARHLEFRSTGPFPFTGAAEDAALGWIRPAVPVPIDAPVIAALCDAWWPAMIARFRTPRPMGTVAFTMQILGTPSGEAPLAYRARTWAQRGGWIVEQRELWTERGELVALNQQTIAIIK